MNKHIEDFMTEASKSAQAQEKSSEKAEVAVSVISGFAAKI